MTVPSRVIVPSTDEFILTNGADLERWAAYKKKIYSVLFLPTKGAANNFLARFTGRLGSRKKTDE